MDLQAYLSKVGTGFGIKIRGNKAYLPKVGTGFYRAIVWDKDTLNKKREYVSTLVVMPFEP